MAKLDYKENIPLFQTSRMHTFWWRENIVHEIKLTVVFLTPQKPWEWEVFHDDIWRQLKTDVNKSEGDYENRHMTCEATSHK